MKRSIAKVLVVAAISSVALIGCSAGTNEYAEPQFAVPAVETIEPVNPESPYGSAETNERANLVKEIGQPGGLQNLDGSVMVDFKVTKISAKKCPAPDYPSENGKFIQVDLAMTTHDDPDLMLSGVMLAYGWESINANGESVPSDTSAAAVCMEEPVPSLKPNRKYTATVVLDVQKDVDVIVWTPFLADGGWEWKV